MSQVRSSIELIIRRSWKALPASVKSNIRPLLPKKAAPVRSDMKRQPISKPLLSVVIPVHNVIHYLAECLDSVLSQDYQNLEVIIVDDGSTDGSAELVEDYAGRDRRIHFVKLDHGGNGLARNRGISLAKGEYLAFVDSDDVVMPGAYTNMIQHLTLSGSDFVVGAFRRRKGNREWLPEMMSELHGSDRLGIVVDDFPMILRDIFLWNKVFKRSFWNDQVGFIPEGVLYEDQETIVRAFLRANSFDILQKPVYVWRIREDNSSITQQKGNITDLSDRMKAALTVTELVIAEGNEGTRQAWFVKSLGEDLRPYLVKVPDTGPDYWQVLQSAVGSIYAAAGPSVLPMLPLAQRVLAYLIAEDRQDDFEDVLVSLRDHGQTFPIVAEAETLIASPVFADDLSVRLPPAILEITDVDTKIHTRLLDLRWLDHDCLEIRASAYITAIDSSRFSYKATLTLVNTTTEVTLPVEAVMVTDPRVDQISGDRWNTYSGSVFTARINTVDLLGSAEQATPNGQEWSLRVSVQAAGLTKIDVIRVRDGELLPFQLPIEGTAGAERVVAQIDRNQGLRLRVVRYGSMVRRIEAHGRVLDFVFTGARSELPKLLFLKSGQEELSAIATDTADGRVFSVEIPNNLPKNKEASWDVLGKSANDRIHYVGWPECSVKYDSLPAPDGAVRVSVTGYGYLRVTVRAWRVTVSECSFDTDRNLLTVSGRSSHVVLGGEQLLDLILATNRAVIAPVSIKMVPGTEKFSAVFALATDKWGYGEGYPEAGHYRLLQRTVSTDGKVRRQRVTAVGSLLEGLPNDILAPRARIALTAEDRERTVVVKILAPYKLDERGPVAQQILRDRYLTGHGSIDKDAVLLESFGGKSSTDSVAAISEVLGRRYPQLRRYWTVSDFSVPVPDGCIGVLIYSAEWYTLLNSAGTLVNNNNFPPYFKKRAEQLYIQTWHGTPLKKIGKHTPLDNLSASYRRLMEREAAAWDILVSQNDFAAEVLPAAFGYSGVVINAGYPRNDSLYCATATERRAKVRNRLGLEKDSIAVLYTPTWRDNVRTAQNKFDAVNYLEFDKLAAAQGGKFVILFRGHHNVAGQRNTADDSTFIDVTGYPEISDLYLAADVMITDYSSSMFDFCGTKKPLIFLAPDIKEYSSVTRGFYFDFVAEAPGPIVASTEEVIALLNNLPAMGEAYRDRYTAFVNKYAPLDDGNSAERVVDLIPVLGEVESAHSVNI